MEKRSINVLLAEGDSDALHLIWEMLLAEENIFFHIEAVSDLPATMTSLRQQQVHVVVLDLALTNSETLVVIQQIQTVAPDTALVVLTTHDDERGGMLAVQAGAQDYLVKDDLNRLILVRALQHAVERKQLQIERVDALEREQEARLLAEQANLLKEKFMGVVSHELRSPLTSVLGFASTLLADDVSWDIETTREFIGIIRDEALKMGELIDELLDFTQQQQGSLPIMAKEHALQDAVALGLPQLKTFTSKHQLVIEIPTTLPQVIIDPQRIAQVIVNLVSNATKFSPAQSTITIHARQWDDDIRVDVQNTGSAIPETDQQRIFEAFQQSNSLVSGKQGVGLGLTIAKGLVEAHKGQLWLQQSNDTGTVFSFTIPLIERR